MVRLAVIWMCLLGETCLSLFHLCPKPPPSKLVIRMGGLEVVRMCPKRPSVDTAISLVWTARARVPGSPAPALGEKFGPNMPPGSDPRAHPLAGKITCHTPCRGGGVGCLTRAMFETNAKEVPQTRSFQTSMLFGWFQVDLQEGTADWGGFYKCGCTSLPCVPGIQKSRKRDVAWLFKSKV